MTNPLNGVLSLRAEKKGNVRQIGYINFRRSFYHKSTTVLTIQDSETVSPCFDP